MKVGDKVLVLDVFKWCIYRGVIIAIRQSSYVVRLLDGREVNYQEPCIRPASEDVQLEMF